MKKITLFIIITTLFFLSVSFAKEKLNVVSTYPYIESLVKEIGMEKVSTFCLSKGNEDPHFVIPRPSFIAKLRNADIFIINGASIEIGFVPPLLRQANNRKINPGGSGFLDLSQYVSIIEKPEKISRTEGDVHPEGNPHFYLDYYNIIPIANAILNTLIENSPSQKKYYQQNYDKFIQKLDTKIKEWDKKISILSNKKAIQYHRLFNYFFKRANMQIFAEIEPKPGIPPTSRHTENILLAAQNELINAVIIDVYHNKKPAEQIATKLNAPLLILPHDVNALDNVNDIFALFDYIIGRLTNG